MKKQKTETIVFELTPNPDSFDKDLENDVMFGTFKAYPKQKPKKSKKKK